MFKLLKNWFEIYTCDTWEEMDKKLKGIPEIDFDNSTSPALFYTFDDIKEDRPATYIVVSE